MEREDKVGSGAELLLAKDDGVSNTDFFFSTCILADYRIIGAQFLKTHLSSVLMGSEDTLT